MAPRSFPLSLRIGVDLCKIDRIKSIIQPKIPKSYHASDFFRKLLTPRELQYFKLRFNGPQMRRESESQKIANYLAGRWAAKEACIKAVKPRKLTISEVEIWPDEKRELYAIVLDKKDPTQDSPDEGDCIDSTTMGSSKEAYLKGVERDSGVRLEQDGNSNRDPLEFVPTHEHIDGQILRISITHDSDYACAVALYASGGSMEERITNLEKELTKLQQSQETRDVDTLE